MMLLLTDAREKDDDPLLHARSDNELILCQLVANQYTNNKQRH